MMEPVAAQLSPYAVECEQGKRSWWFACDRSKTQPFRDGTHFSP